jgi:hypothetical protein
MAIEGVRTQVYEGLNTQGKYVKECTSPNYITVPGQARFWMLHRCLPKSLNDCLYPVNFPPCNVPNLQPVVTSCGCKVPCHIVGLAYASKVVHAPAALGGGNPIVMLQTVKTPACEVQYAVTALLHIPAP